MARDEVIRARMTSDEIKMVRELQKKLALPNYSEVIRYCIRDIYTKLDKPKAVKKNG